MMDFVTDVIAYCLVHTGYSYYQRRRWRKEAEICNVYRNHLALPIRPLGVRPRRLTMSESDSQTRPAAVLQSRLMLLPPEIRLQIWEHVLGGQFVAIYRDGDRLTHCVLDDTNSKEPARDNVISTRLIRYTVKLLQQNSTKKRTRRKSQPQKLSAIALLQSCRSM